MIDWFNETAKRCHGRPDGWQWFSLDGHNKPEGFIELKGAVPCGVKSRGINKGSPKWPKEHEVVWMRHTDIAETKTLWELATGLCSKCQGRGQESAGWSASEGERLRECSRCNGTKTAKEQPCLAI